MIIVRLLSIDSHSDIDLEQGGHMLSSISMIVSVGSVDGVCTTSALLRLVGAENVGLQFAQAFTVNKVDPTKWSDGQKVALVDLAVNNRDKAMTVDFIRRIREAGHEIVAVIDEHNREDWFEVLGTFEGLIIEPQSQSEGIFKSSGSVLMAAVGNDIDDHTIELLNAADVADRMDFNTRFGGIVNKAVKSAIWDDSRRIHLARHLASGAVDPDEKMAGWIAEYDEILHNHDNIVSAKVDLGDGIHRVNALGVRVDMTTLMFRLYSEGARVVVLYGEAYLTQEKCKRPILAFGTNDKSLNLLSIIMEAGINSLGGFAQKVNVELVDESKSIEAIRAAL